MIKTVAISIKKNSDNKYIHKIELEDKKWIILDKIFLPDSDILNFQEKFGMSSLNHLDSSVSIFDKENKETESKFVFNGFTLEVKFNEKEFLPEILTISCHLFSEEDACNFVRSSKFDKIKLI